MSHEYITSPTATLETPPPTLSPTAPCPRCQHPGPHRIAAGTPPHHQKLACGACGRYLKWLPKPRPASSQEVHP
jgi:hypothetical protein